MITSPHNDKLKEVRRLQRRRERRFVAEGEDLLAAAAQAGWPAVYELHAGVDVEADLLDGVSGLGSGTRALGVFEQRWGAVTGPLGPDDQRSLQRPAQRLAGAGHQRDPGRGQLRHAAHARDGDLEDRAHRGAYRLGAEGIGRLGPQRDRRGAEGQRAAQHRADVAGVAHAPQRHAQRAADRAPTLLEDAQRAGARAQARDAVEQIGLDVDPGAQLVDRRPARIGGGRQQVLALGHEAPLAAALEPADLLELLVVRAGDQGVGG